MGIFDFLKRKPTTSVEETIDDGFARTYGFELLFSEKPEISIKDALIDLEKSVGKIDQAGDNQNHFFMAEHLVEYSDNKKLPSQIVLIHADQKKDNDSLETEIQQSWQTPNASEIVSMSNYKVLLTDLMSAGLSVKERQFILTNALQVFVKHSNCIGVSCKRTQQIIDANEVKSDLNPLLGFINVRFFNAGEDGFVMDSLGLSALGLHDIQCNFINLDPNEVSNHLYSIASYIFNEEPIFENGHTIAGLNGKNWLVQSEVSLVAPTREVIDLNPGTMYSPRNR